MRLWHLLVVLTCVASAAMFSDVAGAQETAAPAPPTPEATVDAAPAVDADADAKPQAAGDEAAHAEEEAHAVPNVAWYWMLPFALLLASIAIMPLVSMHFWEHNYPWFAGVLGAITAVYYLFIFDDPHAPAAWLHEMQEYVSFIALLGSLYMVSGGIVIHVSRKATPLTNTVLLGIGAVIANIFGTTGAAMLLIRPYIRINRAHIKPYHIVFFIFIVANVGGSLTPIGDPPLFMGYLKGVPFFWVLEALWPMWATAVAILLVVFFILDTREHAKNGREAHEKDAGRAVEIFGFSNFLFIGLILFAVFRPSMFEALHDNPLMLPFSREVLMLAAALGSRFTTKRYIYERNEFTYGPIKEVAILFVGIFSTMVPALNYLNHHSEQMPLHTPGQYYFVTGALSSVLDNAPTYLVFLETKRGSIDAEHDEELAIIRRLIDQKEAGQTIGTETIEREVRAVLEPRPAGDELPAETAEEFEQRVQETVLVIQGGIDELRTYHGQELAAGTITDSQINLAYLIGHPISGLFLVAISIGAVFFGACTYIGNGPNFMVKSIAESAGIQMPSFFGYVVKYTLPILIPIYVVIWFVFFVLKIGV